MRENSIQNKKRAKRFVIPDEKRNSYLINEKQIEKDKKLEGFKAIIIQNKILEFHN